MILTIFRRELLDHLASVRFGIALVLTVLLFVLNGVLFAGGEFDGHMQAYNAEQTRTSEWQERHAEKLADLAMRGPGWLNKRPSALVFCASGRDEFLPTQIGAQTGSTRSSSRWGISIHGPWHLRYSTRSSPPVSGVVSDFVEIDWVFIIGFVLSLSAVLLTYDAICGERAQGTLRLLLSQPVSRFGVLAGKFLAACATLGVALAIGMTLCLLVIGLSGTVALDAALLGKVIAMLAASLLYLSFFIALGLLVSTRTERPAAALVTLLLIWTTLLVLVPNTLAGVASYFGEEKLDWEGRQAAIDALWEEHELDKEENPTPDGRMPYDYVKRFTDYIDERLALERSYQEAFLRQHLDQVRFGRNLNRISPYGVFQYALESLADTGLSRHQRFIEAARAYAAEFRTFIDARDQADGDSYHLFGIDQGMSQKPVPLETIPQFHEDLSVTASVAGTVTDLTILALFALVAIMAANAAFLRGDVV